MSMIHSEIKRRKEELEEAVLEIALLLRRLGVHVEEMGPQALEALQRLSPRERQVVVSLLRTPTIEAVVHDLAIRRNTVRHHLRNIYRKLGVRSRTELFDRLRT